jgi:molybdopterin converting factor subunit 1
MTITVHLFAAARDLAGNSTTTVELPAGATVAVLRATLSNRYPALAPLLARSAVAVNQEYAEDSVVLSPGDELAVIPPVSGG